VEQEWTIEEPELSDKIDLLTMCHLVFVDNITFLFESPQCMESGSQTIREHYPIFGLVMHVGRGDKKSKTEECMYLQN
jgi:hypothetical protein